MEENRPQNNPGEGRINGFEIRGDNGIPGGQQMPPPFRNPRRKKGMPIWLILVLSLVGVVCVGFTTAWFFYLRSQKDVEADVNGKEVPVVVAEAEEVAPAEEVVKEVPLTERKTEKREPAPAASSSQSNQYTADAFVCDASHRYPIRMIYTLRDDGRVTGKYAYASTVRKYGDKPESWFTISGTYEKNMAYTSMSLKSYLYGKSTPYETMHVRVTSSGMSGYLTNCETGTRLDIEP